LARNTSGSYDDAESDLENQILDSNTEADQSDTESDQNPKS